MISTSIQMQKLKSLLSIIIRFLGYTLRKWFTFCRPSFPTDSLNSSTINVSLRKLYVIVVDPQYRFGRCSLSLSMIFTGKVPENRNCFETMRYENTSGLAIYKCTGFSEQNYALRSDLQVENLITCKTVLTLNDTMYSSSRSGWKWKESKNQKGGNVTCEYRRSQKQK